MRRLAVVLGILLALVDNRGVGAAESNWFPTRLAHLGNAQQALVVVGTGGTYATLHAYQRDSGTWREIVAPMKARIGYGGWAWAAKRVQDTGTTPIGTFTLTEAFGLAPDPGTKLPYRRVGPHDYWVGDARDARTYNLFQPEAASGRTWRISQAERLASFPIQYAYAVVVDFNRPAPATVSWSPERGEFVTSHPAAVGRGSAIFLHVNGKGDTAGCVSVSRDQLWHILRWLDPADHPRIVMAPLNDITRA